MSDELHIAIHFIIWVIVFLGIVTSLDKTVCFIDETVKENQIVPSILGSILVFIPIEIIYWSLYSIIF